MLHVSGILEDTNFFAEYMTDHGSKPWRLVTCDNMTGKEQEIWCSNEQLGAVMGLAFGGEDNPVLSALYPLAEEVMKGFTSGNRMIP